MDNSFFSIEIRDLNFDYDRYYLSLKNTNKNILLNNNSHHYKTLNKDELPKDAISDITSYTVLPKFSIDKILSPLLYQIFNIDYTIINEKEDTEYSKDTKEEKKEEEKKETKTKKLKKKNKKKEDNKDNKGNENIINEEDKKDNDKDKINIEKKKEMEKEEEIKEFTINVMSYTTKEIKCSFNVRYPLFPEYYNYLGKTPDNFKLLQFPCIILQSDTGLYALKKIITTKKKNRLIEEEINLAIQINKDSFFESLFTNRQKPIPAKKKNIIDFEKIMQYRGLYNSTLSSLKEKKQELNNKKKELNSLIEERKKILEKKQKILSCHKYLENTKGSWNRLITLKEVLTKVNSYTTEIISIKEKKISECNKEIKKYKEEVKKKRNKDIPSLQRINNGLQVTNYLLYKYALNELCYYFFNKKVNTYYAFPTFYKINLTDLNLSKKIVEDFYNTNKKEVSAMFGNIIYLLNYLSKKFDIIFPYSLYYNGSKSMVFISMGGKGWAIDMYMKENERNLIGTKNENDIQVKRELLSKMIYDVIMFFYSRRICSDNLNVENLFNSKKNRNNIYLYFMKLNEIFKDILSK